MILMVSMDSDDVGVAQQLWIRKVFLTEGVRSYKQGSGKGEEKSGH